MKTGPDKLRAWQRRSKPLARGTSSMKRSKLAPVNRKRAAKRKAECFGPQAQACRDTSCCVLHCDAPAEPHHEPPRSLGGIDRDCVPLCRDHHRRRHDMGANAFWTWTGVDPARVKYRMQLVVKGAA